MAAHDNRGRLAVDINGSWRLYTTYLPVGARAFGVVTSSGETGALVQMGTGLYARVNAGAVVSLPQRKVTQALEAERTGSGGAGRGQGAKTADGVTNVQRYNITLDQASDEAARLLGEGDRSLGIRRSLAHVITSTRTNPPIVPSVNSSAASAKL